MKKARPSIAGLDNVNGLPQLGDVLAKAEAAEAAKQAEADKGKAVESKADHAMEEEEL